MTLVGIADNDSALVNLGEGAELVMVSDAIRGNGCGSVRTGRGTFTMSGGELSGGNAALISIGNIYGGDLQVAGDGVFTMSGGEITGNNATGVNSGGGGGVNLVQTPFTMEGGEIYGNSATSASGINGGGIFAREGSTFILKGGRIQGGTESDGFAANTVTVNSGAALQLYQTTANWGTGGTYTRGGVNQSGGGNIASTNDTLIAIPAR